MPRLFVLPMGRQAGGTAIPSVASITPALISLMRQTFALRVSSPPQRDALRRRRAAAAVATRDVHDSTKVCVYR